MALDRVVRVFESSAVAVPVMVGWIKPVVLLPAAALSGLTPTQVEALIAHELAHVRRHDYIVNLLQSVVETLLFYHPAVWWVSARVRAEREHCCDDLAVGVCDRLVYVTALADLAAMTDDVRRRACRDRRFARQPGATDSGALPRQPRVDQLDARRRPRGGVRCDVAGELRARERGRRAIADAGCACRIAAASALAIREGVQGAVAGGVRRRSYVAGSPAE